MVDETQLLSESLGSIGIENTKWLKDLMEYERIDKVKSDISPSKLRTNLMGPHHHKKNDGLNSNS